MATRTKAGTVAFARPFFLQKIDRELPAGSYAIEIEEEALEGASTLSYRRIAVRLFVPQIPGKSDAEMWVVSPGEFDAALALDREPPRRREPDPYRTAPAPHPAATVREIEEFPVHNRNAMQNRNKGSNTPLYGTLLGILALLLATVVLGRQEPVESTPSLVQAAGSAEN